MIHDYLSMIVWLTLLYLFMFRTVSWFSDINILKDKNVIVENKTICFCMTRCTNNIDCIRACAFIFMTIYIQMCLSICRIPVYTGVSRKSHTWGFSESLILAPWSKIEECSLHRLKLKTRCSTTLLERGRFLKVFLKHCTLGALRKFADKVFHNFGPITAKDLSPKAHFVFGMARRVCLDWT